MALGIITGLWELSGYGIRIVSGQFAESTADSDRLRFFRLPIISRDALSFNAS
jgi:hypothetical protein